MDDREIVVLFLRRDEHAIEQLSVKYGSMIRSIAYRITGSMEISEECENDTYMKAWNLIPPNEPYDYLAAFLSRIVRNVALNRCVYENRSKRKGYIEELSAEMEQILPSDTSAEHELNKKELLNAINLYLRAQPKEKRIVFMRRCFDCEKISTIAKSMGWKETKVRTMLCRMREELKEYLKKEGII